MKQKYLHNFDFAITTYCQAKCRSCARTNESTGEKEKWLKLQHMDFDLYQKVLQNKLDYWELTLCGEFGDPMMHPEIEKFVDYGLTIFRRVHINTNGGLRQPSWYKRVAQKHTYNVMIDWGIDGTDHDTNWLYREGVNYERAMENMHTWFSNGGGGAWHFLIFDWNWFQIPEAIHIAKDIGCKLEFKFNNRKHGLISPENKNIAWDLLEEYYEVQD